MEQYEELDNNDEVFTDVRKPGADIWPEIRRYVDKKKLKQELKQKLEKQERQEIQLPPEEVEELQKQLEQLSVVHVAPEYPQKVEPDLLHHVVIFGPEGCGKTEAA